jgi:hypothetical protein
VRSAQVKTVGNALVWLGCAVIMGRVLAGHDGALNFDENQQIFRALYNGKYSYLNHLPAQWSSGIAAALGATEQWQFRIPSYIMSLIVISLLIWGVRAVTSLSVQLAVIASVACNTFVVWQLQSVRGYVWLMAATLTMYLLAVEATQEKKVAHLNLKRGVLFFSGFVACGSHYFGTLFVVLLTAGLIAWSALTEELTAKQQETVRSYLRTLWLLFPLVTFVTILQFDALYSRDRIASTVSAEPAQKSAMPLLTAFMTLGYWQAMWAGLSLALFCGLVAWNRWMFPRSKCFIDFFALFSICALTILTAMLRMPALEVRFFSPFAIPLILTLWNVVANVRERELRGAAVLAATILTMIVPLAQTSEVYLGQMSGFSGFDRLAKHARAIQSKDPKACFECVGEARKCDWMLGTHLKTTYEQLREKRLKGCESSYGFVFSTQAHVLQEFFAKPGKTIDSDLGMLFRDYRAGPGESHAKPREQNLTRASRVD